MEPEGLLPYTHQLTTDPYPEPDESNPRPHPVLHNVSVRWITYMRGPELESRSGDRLSWLRFLRFTSVPSGKIQYSTWN
jgi:hypothetical protein